MLVGKGNTSYLDFVRFAKEEKQISEEDAREALGIMVHHSIVHFTLPDSEKDQNVDHARLLSNKAVLLPQTEVKYSFQLDAVLLRLRFPHFVHLAATELGKGESLVLQVVCLLGHCSLTEIEEAFAEQHASDSIYFHQYFTSLVQVRSVCRFVRTSTNRHGFHYLCRPNSFGKPALFRTVEQFLPTVELEWIYGS